MGMAWATKRMNTSVESKMVLGFAISLLALAGLGWLSYRTTTNLVTTEKWVAHTQEVISALEAGHAILTDAETSQRGYLLTGEDAFLKDSQKAQTEAKHWLDQLHGLIADNPEQQQRLDQLEPLISQWLDLLNNRINLRQEKGLQVATRAVASREGRGLMDRIWGEITEMQGAENRLLSERQHAAQVNATTGAFLVLTGGGLACAINLTALVVIRRDLKLRALAEKDIQAARTQLQSFLDNTPADVFLKDTDGHYLFANRQFETTVGIPRDKIVGQTGFDIFPKEVAQATHENDQKVLKTGEPFQFEETILYADGPHTHFSVKFPLRDANGNIYATGGVSTDITRRKLAEEERDRFFNLSRDMMCIAGFDGYFKRLNPAWEQTLGFTVEELLSKPFLDFIHSDDIAATTAKSAGLSTGQEVIQFENRYRCKDGSYRWFAWNARADLPRQLIYATARDITPQKQNEEQIVQLNTDLQTRATQLETANKELEAFSYSVSHDLRAPLRHIDGFVKLLDKQAGEKMDEHGRRYLNIIADSARQMGALIDDLLIFSRMNRTELRHARVSQDALVHEAIDGLHSETNGRHINWKIASLPEVEADPAMLRQVWVNLIANAVKYCRPRNPAEIEIGCNTVNGEFVFFVRDNGVGFDMQYAHKLFGVFQRLHHAEEFEGTGIGLANVRRIVHRHGGRTWAEGKIDGGATFFFSLPKTPTETKG
jgi:PAS domain S-box-containing protein